jgi:chromosome segregation ATPase
MCEFQIDDLSAPNVNAARYRHRIGEPFHLTEETMTDDLAELRDRHDKLQGRVTVLEVTVKEEAALRAKMDSDLGDMKTTLNAHTRALQAVHDTQSDHTRRLTRIEGDVATLKDDVGTLKEDVGSLKEQMRDVRAGVHAILDLLGMHLVRKPWWASRKLRLPRSR